MKLIAAKVVVTMQGLQDDNSRNAIYISGNEVVAVVLI